MSVSESADFSTVKLNTATKIVQRMIAEGLVKTRVRPTDGRVTEVCLTGQGDALRAQALVEVSRIQDESFLTFLSQSLRHSTAFCERSVPILPR